MQLGRNGHHGLAVTHHAVMGLKLEKELACTGQLALEIRKIECFAYLVLARKFPCTAYAAVVWYSNVVKSSMVLVKFIA